MDYQIALHPDLGINAKEFIDIWNTEEESKHLTTAKLASPPVVSFPLDLAAFGIAALSFTVGSIASGAIYDVVKHITSKAYKKHFGKEIKEKLTLQTFTLHDGTKVIILTKEIM